METDFESLLVHGQPDVQLLNAKSSALPCDVGLQSIRNTPHAVPGVYNSVYTNQNYPNTMFPFQPKPKETQPHSRLYHLPGFGQGFANVVLNERYLPSVELSGKVPTSTSGCSPKQFLVFDQSGDKTTLIYRSGIDTPVCLNPWSSSNSKQPHLKHSNEEAGKIGAWSDMHNAYGPSLTDELNANSSEAEDKSEMREDTEEINALLYSDDDSAQNEEDDDVASTGHSPSIITAYKDCKQDWADEVEDGEEVASSGGPIKKQKISEDGYNVPCLTDTASSAKTSRTFQVEDDAESKCTNSNCARSLNDYDDDDSDSICDKKISRKERIRETVEILQSIIPCSQGKGMDAALVLDESIRYLRSLKRKARSLGL